MLHCATQKKAGLVIVTRDADYGVAVDEKTSYINDHLRQEFSERVSRKRKLLLYSRLSDALKLFEVPVSPQEEEAEKEIVSTVTRRETASSVTNPRMEFLSSWINKPFNPEDSSEVLKHLDLELSQLLQRSKEPK